MRIRSLLLIALTALLAGCGPATDDPAAEAAPRLTVTGSSTLAPLLAEIGKRFEQRHPGWRIDVQAGGSSRGITDVRQGTAAIGMASRALEARETDLQAHPLASDGIALIVHRDNPLSALSAAQVAAIYSGRLDDWRQLGGAERPIVVVNKADGRATLAVFLAHFGLAREAIRADAVVGHNQQGIKTVAGNPGAIGYVSIGAALVEAERGVPIKLLTLDGVAPTLDNVASGRYPIARPLNLVTLPAPNAPARTFLDYARSEAVHDLVRQLSFVPLGG